MLFYRHADAIISVFESSGLLLLLARKMFRFAPKLVLWDASVGNTWRILRTIQRIAFPRYDGFMMLTSSQVNYLVRQHSRRQAIAQIFYNIDETFYKPDPDRELDYVFSIGDDISRDYLTLLKAARRVQSPIVIKSRWHPPDPNEAVPTNVRFVSNHLDRHELRNLYAMARLVVLPLHEVAHAGGITALFEAMAMGKALVVTDTSLARDFVAHEVNALVVPISDPNAMVLAINRLATDENLRLALGANARRHIEQNFSSPAFAQRMGAFLREICRDEHNRDRDTVS